MIKYHIDQTDQKILSFLVKNARMPFLEIARECGVSGAAIHQRVKRLEANGVITGSRLLVKPQAIGLNICAFTSSAYFPVTKWHSTTSGIFFKWATTTLYLSASDNEMLMKAQIFNPMA